MSHNTLPTVAELSGEMRERLAKVKYVFTDLDATMLAPGSCVLRDNDGNPSTKLVEAVVALARAGIQVVPTSGRNRTMIHEDARVLGLNSYIGEMGGLVMYDLKANDWEYLTGDMPYDPGDRADWRVREDPRPLAAQDRVSQRHVDRLQVPRGYRRHARRHPR